MIPARCKCVCLRSTGARLLAAQRQLLLALKMKIKSRNTRSTRILSTPTTTSCAADGCSTYRRCARLVARVCWSYVRSSKSSVRMCAPRCGRAIAVVSVTARSQIFSARRKTSCDATTTSTALVGLLKLKPKKSLTRSSTNTALGR